MRLVRHEAQIWPRRSRFRTSYLPASQCRLEATTAVMFIRDLPNRHHRIDALPAEIADAIEGSKVSPAHDHRNELLDEK
jgi:hypothetical protein